MRDIPVFTTDNGVGSLTLKNIPYTAEAYVRVHDISDLYAFLKECVDFCRAVGAERIYASCGSKELCLPQFTEVWEMSGAIEQLPDTRAVAHFVADCDLEQWRHTYNLHMKDVPTAAYLSAEDLNNRKGNLYYIYDEDVIIGLGIASNGRIDGIVSLCHGKGQDVLLALCNTMSLKRVVLEVASENGRAVSLYRRLGFEKTTVVNVWYLVYPK